MHKLAQVKHIHDYPRWRCRNSRIIFISIRFPICIEFIEKYRNVTVRTLCLQLALAQASSGSNRGPTFPVSIWTPLRGAGEGAPPAAFDEWTFGAVWFELASKQAREVLRAPEKAMLLSLSRERVVHDSTSSRGCTAIRLYGCTAIRLYDYTALRPINSKCSCYCDVW